MVFDRVVFGILWPSGSKIPVFDRVVQKFRYFTEWFLYLTEWFRYVTDEIISTALVITSSRWDYLGSLASLDSGAKVDLCKARIRVRVRARDSFQKQALQNHSVKYRDFRTTRSNTGIFEPLGQNPKTTRSNTVTRETTTDSVANITLKSND